MDARIEHAVDEGLQIAQACAGQQKGSVEPASTPVSRTAALTRLAARYMPVVMAVLVVGTEPEIINIVWGQA